MIVGFPPLIPPAQCSSMSFLFKKKRKKRKGGTNLKLVSLLGEQSALRSLDEVVYSKEQTDEVEDIIGSEK